MTTDQIIAKCEKTLELSQKYDEAAQMNSGVPFREYDERRIASINNATTFAPSAAQALKVAIEALESIVGNDNSRECAGIVSAHALQQIAEAFK